MEPELLKLLASGSVTPIALYGIYILSKIAARLAALDRKVDLLVVAFSHTLPADQRATFLERNLLRQGETETILKNVITPAFKKL